MSVCHYVAGYKTFSIVNETEISIKLISHVEAGELQDEKRHSRKADLTTQSFLCMNKIYLTVTIYVLCILFYFVLPSENLSCT